MKPIRQHLIDPEICIRCNTCEETCPVDAITHNDVNYVVDVNKCNYCMDCISPCPTGAIDNWRLVTQPYSLEEQFGWEELPPDTLPAGVSEEEREALENEATEILEVAHAGQGGRVVPPFSAAHPYINLYSREAPARATVVGNYRITDPQAESDIHHIVLDFGKTAFPVLEGQSIGIIPPGVDEKGRPHLVRLYSVASPRDGERPKHNNVALTVKRVRYEQDGEIHYGVASNYVCDLQKGDEVLVTGPFGNTFLMPNHPTANIIMICTGTGAAPFRAMTERRRRHLPEAPGKLLLFFGARTPGELPYFGPLMKLPHSLIDKELVFSRAPDQPKEYVQDRMRSRAADIARLLESEDTYVFICGLKGMEQGVTESFDAICREHGLDWGRLLPRMRQTGRYHVETY
ncbi:MAG TPA: benzoyl-CoA 2,3-epoxidase subunit BoxA [Candidatus Competibacteraceae bacterium]|nr:benzoyl-CoA 2,3-epoxidase subunit BoxA [Candidatus Competibacteraceae bacterium]